MSSVEPTRMKAQIKTATMQTTMHPMASDQKPSSMLIFVIDHGQRDRAPDHQDDPHAKKVHQFSLR